MAEFANWQWVDLEETSSTNDEVKRLCAAAPSGKRFMVAARRQNAGRGRRGRGWAYDRNLDCWENEGFAPIRENWLKYAKNLGAGITVNMEKERKTGKFAGVDENGVLLLETPSGIEKIYAGDIFYLKEKENK